MNLAVAGRLPGRCLPGDFDCGFGRCVPITVFHDGKPDCYDGSDECLLCYESRRGTPLSNARLGCFFGQVKCGAYCVDVSQALSCLFSPKCDDSSRQPQWCAISKEKLCGDPSSFPCKGYGECVLWPWLLDGKKHCIDGSDGGCNL
ncbi:Low-density lipoprotein receptor domain class A [Oesophagostomum dentatum]|uniref:Low-density lipoprotein receptor domain class A n=1 Tax=Oesophagostomum dentatum TaxID=61180 RepID=A0A0B1SHY9_OESDE|nr:Low-density lipoprotein receptor domain class A [Oesophagostomum dentatum]